jgi:hypothetical protein
MSTAAGDVLCFRKVDLGGHGAAGSGAPLDELVVLHEDVRDDHLKLKVRVG